MGDTDTPHRCHGSLDSRPAQTRGLAFAAHIHYHVHPHLLWSYTFWFCHLFMGDWNDDPYRLTFQGSFIIAGCAVPFDFLIAYPTSQLRFGGEKECASLLAALTVLHGVGFYAMHRGIRRLIRLRGGSS